MTLDEFLQALRETPRDWTTCNGRIRLRGDYFDCPITAVANSREPRDPFLPSQWDIAANFLGCRPLAEAIVYAADTCAGPLRNQLLTACGLPSDGSKT